MFKKFVLLLLLPMVAAASGPLQQAKIILNKMTLDEKIAQKLMIDFRYWCDPYPLDVECTQDLTRVNPSIRKLLTDNPVGGVILFKSNLKDTPQILSLTSDLQRVMRFGKHLPLLIGIDQEGGQIVRLPQDQATNFSGNMSMAAAFKGNARHNYADQVGYAIAQEVHSLGINVNFVPDVDVNINPDNPIIGVRSFGDNVDDVVLLGQAFSQGTQAAGVASSLKHFPGHGDTSVDSHLGLPRVSHRLAQAWQIDLYPFQKIIANSNPDMVMVAHIQYPALDKQTIYADKLHKNIMVPATLSYPIVTGLLRDKLNYHGVIVTDALHLMKAISDNFSMKTAVIDAFVAGNDIALMPLRLDGENQARKLVDLIQSVHDAVLSGVLSEKALDESVLRILQLKLKLGLLKPNLLPLDDKIARANSMLNNSEHRQLEQTLANQSVTLVKNNGVLPIKPNLSDHHPLRIHVLMPSKELASFSEKMKSFQGESKLTPSCLESSSFEQQKFAIDHADVVIAGNSMIVPSASDKEVQLINQVLAYAKQQHKQTIYISLVSPYDLSLYESVSDAMLAGYSDRDPVLLAEVRVIFGDLQAEGRLPVKLMTSQ